MARRLMLWSVSRNLDLSATNELANLFERNLFLASTSKIWCRVAILYPSQYDIPRGLERLAEEHLTISFAIGSIVAVPETLDLRQANTQL